MKKAQMEINETIIVLFIFFMLLIFGVIFYARFQNIVYQNQERANLELEMIKLSQTVIKLPELAYSHDNALKDYVDVMKVDNFTTILNGNPDYFSGPMHNTRIILKPYDPFNDVEGQPKIIYDSPLEGALYNKTTFVPVLLYDKRTDESSFAILELTWYVK